MYSSMNYNNQLNIYGLIFTTCTYFIGYYIYLYR